MAASSERPEVVEAEATPIESDIDIVSAFDRKVSAWERAAADEAGQHEACEIASREGYEAALAARKSVRRAKRRIEDERTEFLRPVKSAVSSMEARVRDATAPLKALDDALSREIAGWERRARREREAMLAEAYAEFAPMLADMAPYERLAGVFDPDGTWLSDKLDDDKARELMEHAVGKVSDGYEFVNMQRCAPDELEELKTEFFLCLDATAAISRVVEARRQREAVAAFEAERAERERASQEAQAAAEHKEMVAEAIWEADPEASGVNAGGAVLVTDWPERTEQTPVRKTPPPARPVDTGSVVTPDEFEGLRASIGGSAYAAPAPGPAPSVAEQVAEAMASPVPGEEVPPYALFAYVTEAQRSQLVAFCGRRGIHGGFKATHGRRMTLVPREG